MFGIDFGDVFGILVGVNGVFCGVLFVFVGVGVDFVLLMGGVFLLLFLLVDVVEFVVGVGGDYGCEGVGVGVLDVFVVGVLVMIVFFFRIGSKIVLIRVDGISFYWNGGVEVLYVF